jgi:hypothetical protein
MKYSSLWNIGKKCSIPCSVWLLYYCGYKVYQSNLSHVLGTVLFLEVSTRVVYGR